MLLDNQISYFQRKPGQVQSAASAWYTRVGGWVDMSPLRTVSQFSIVVQVLWSQGPLAFRAIGFRGPFLSCKSKKCGSNPLLFREKPRVVSSLLTADCHVRMGFMVRLCFSFSYTLLCGFFLIYPMCKSCSVIFWVVFSGNCFVYSFEIHCIHGMRCV